MLHRGSDRRHDPLPDGVGPFAEAPGRAFIVSGSEEALRGLTVIGRVGGSALALEALLEVEVSRLPRPAAGAWLGSCRAARLAAKSSNVNGSHFSYSGSGYGDGCQKISYGPGGKACTGTLRNQGKGLLFAQFSKAHANEDMRFIVQPFGGLVATPPSCNNDDSPPTPVTAEDVMTLSSRGDPVHRQGLQHRGADRQGRQQDHPVQARQAPGLLRARSGSRRHRQLHADDHR